MSNWKNILLFFVLLFVFSKWGPSIPFSVLSQNKGEPMVVSADAKVPVTPDVAKISVGIENSGQILKRVQDDVNKKSQNIVSELKKLGINEKDIKTTAYNVFPENDYNGNLPTITGYRVSALYEVTIRDFDKINEAMVTATASGANIVGGVSFELSEKLKNEKMGEARKIAADSAKDKAKSLANAAGITLGKIINVSENGTPDFPRPMMEKALPVSGGGDLITEPDIQPGQTEISITISLSYEIR